MEEEDSFSKKAKEPLCARPTECVLCTKPADVTYKRVIDRKESQFSMCKQCPVLQKFLLYTSDPEKICSHCHTTLSSLQRGQPIGCSQCYEVFSSELKNLFSHLPLKETSFHHSKDTKKVLLPLSLRKILQEELHQSIEREHYERAAFIKELLQKEEDELL